MFPWQKELQIVQMSQNCASGQELKSPSFYKHPQIPVKLRQPWALRVGKIWNKLLEPWVHLLWGVTCPETHRPILITEVWHQLQGHSYVKDRRQQSSSRVWLCFPWNIWTISVWEVDCYNQRVIETWDGICLGPSTSKYQPPEVRRFRLRIPNTAPEISFPRELKHTIVV